MVLSETVRAVWTHWQLQLCISQFCVVSDRIQMVCFMKKEHLHVQPTAWLLSPPPEIFPRFPYTDDPVVNAAMHAKYEHEAQRRAAASLQ